MKYIAFLILLQLISLSHQQIMLQADPPAITAFIGETTIVELDGNKNVINGAAWLLSFTPTPDTAAHSWATNIGLKLTFTPASMGQVGSYTIKYEVVETGVGSWVSSPIIRKISLNVAKRPPRINYEIPDYPNLRAAIPFEIKFPQPAWVDPLGDTITYSLVDGNGNAAMSYFNLDIPNNRIHGTVPSTANGVFYFKLYCKDSINQSSYQEFVVNFRANNPPHQYPTDLTPYTVVAGEGASSTHVIPSGKPSHPNPHRPLHRLRRRLHLLRSSLLPRLLLSRLVDNLHSRRRRRIQIHLIQRSSNHHEDRVVHYSLWQSRYQQWVLHLASEDQQETYG